MIWMLIGLLVGMVYIGGEILFARGIAKDHPPVNNLAKQNPVGWRVVVVRG
jgi:hypothetical protein